MVLWCRSVEVSFAKLRKYNDTTTQRHTTLIHTTTPKKQKGD